MSAPKDYQTLPADTIFSAELEPIKGSRFLSYIKQVDSDESAVAFLASIKQKHPDARHWCYAYQLHTGRQRLSDDGEPQGSAGKPILAPIQGHLLYDVMVVVVRYFGGVKLGVGGLVRAYSQACHAAIDAAVIITCSLKSRLQITFAYEQSNAVNRVLASANADVIESTYAEKVCLSLQMAYDEVDAFSKQLIEATGNTVVIVSLDSND